MALPLIWLGGALIGAGIIAEDRERRRKIERDRRLKRGSCNDTSNNSLGAWPSLYDESFKKVKPIPGAIVCCYVFGVIEHTGIWLGDDTLIELHGSGLIRAVSTNRFLAGRTGNEIFLACNHKHQVLVDEAILANAQAQLFNYRDYDVFDNNCHRFVWSCLTGSEESLSSFEKLNDNLAKYFGEPIYWDQASI